MMDRVHAAKIALAVKQKSMRQIVEQVIDHQDSDHLSEDPPSTGCVKGDDEGQYAEVKGDIDQ